MPDNPEKQKKTRIVAKGSMRNMVQYKNMTDAEFDDFYQRVVLGAEKDEVIREKQERLMRQFDEEYDLSELLPNDRLVLSSLVNAIMQLEDFEADLQNIRKDGVDQSNIILIKELNNACATLRKDISSMQDDLKITRKTRKSEKETSVLNFVEDLKTKAKQFAHLKMHYIYCEKCGQLLATVWYQTDAKGNDIRVECKHKLADESICGWTRRITAKELSEMGSNRLDIMPESIR